MTPSLVFRWRRLLRTLHRGPGMTVAVAVVVTVAAGMALADTPGTTLTVTPNTNLNFAGQSVTVSGTGFSANATGSVQQCIVVDDLGTEDCSENLATFTTSGVGTFGPLNVTVSETFIAGGTTKTCSEATPCTLFATLDAEPENDHAPITFTGGGTTTTTITIPPTTTSSTTTTTIPPTTTSSTTTTTVPPTTTSSTTTTTVPPTTTSSTTTSTTSLPATTTTAVDNCTRLQAQRAAVNAQITAIENGLTSANLSPEQQAAAIAQLEAIRAQANATFDAALQQAGCV